MGWPAGAGAGARWIPSSAAARSLRLRQRLSQQGWHSPPQQLRAHRETEVLPLLRCSFKRAHGADEKRHSEEHRVGSSHMKWGLGKE